MRSLLVLLFCGLALVGCQAQPQTDQAKDSSGDGAGTSTTTAASAPNLISEVTDQRTIYVCKVCGMEFDGPGKCSMNCEGELVATQVDYLCPADMKPVEHSGKCPRCAMNAKIVRTEIASPIDPNGATTPETPRPESVPAGESQDGQPGSSGS